MLRIYEVHCTNSRYNLTHLLVSRGDQSALEASLDRQRKNLLPFRILSTARPLGMSAQKIVNLQLVVYQFPGAQVSACSLPNPSKERIPQNRSRPNAFVPTSLSLDCGHRYQFPKKKTNLERIGIVCVCVSSSSLLPVSLPLLVLCCCLLSRVSGIMVRYLS